MIRPAGGCPASARAARRWHAAPRMLVCAALAAAGCASAPVGTFEGKDKLIESIGPLNRVDVTRFIARSPQGACAADAYVSGATVRAFWDGRCGADGRTTGPGILTSVSFKADGRIAEGRWSLQNPPDGRWSSFWLRDDGARGGEPVLISGTSSTGTPASIPADALQFFRQFNQHAVYFASYDAFYAYRKTWREANPTLRQSLYKGMVAAATAVHRSGLADAAVDVYAVKSSQQRERTLEGRAAVQSRIIETEAAKGRYDSPESKQAYAGLAATQRELGTQRTATQLHIGRLRAAPAVREMENELAADAAGRVSGEFAPDGQGCLVEADEESGRSGTLSATWTPVLNACTRTTLVVWTCSFRSPGADTWAPAEGCVKRSTVEPRQRATLYAQLGRPERSTFANAVCLPGSTPVEVRGRWEGGALMSVVQQCRWD